MKTWWFIGESAALAVLDQSLKSYVEQNIKPGEEKHLTDRVVLRNVKNRGMCMNLLQENPKAVKIFSVSAALALTAAQTVTLFRKGYFSEKGICIFAGGGLEQYFRPVGEGWRDRLYRCKIRQQKTVGDYIQSGGFFYPCRECNTHADGRFFLPGKEKWEMRKNMYHRQVVKVWPAGSKLLCLRASREIKTMIQDIQPHQLITAISRSRLTETVLYCTVRNILFCETDAGWNYFPEIFELERLK